MRYADSDHDYWLAQGPEDAEDAAESDADLYFASLALTPEGLDWIPLEGGGEVPWLTQLGAIVAQVHAAERAKAERMRFAA